MTEPMLVGSLLLGADQFIAEFVRQRIPQMREAGASFGPFTAIGVVRRGVLLGGVVYHNFRVHDVEVSVAFDRADWCLPKTLRALFEYPFCQLGCVRMTAVTPRSNEHTQAFLEGLGFNLEGVARKAINGREDAFIYGMLREECRFLREKINGQIISHAAGRA